MSLPDTSAVIVAAGSSTRMGAPKQFISLGGIPLLARTLLAFERCPSVRETVAVIREEDRATVEKLLLQYGIHKVTRLVNGGATRQQSVAHGVAACSPETVLVAVHDGARPLIDPADVEATIAAARAEGAAVTAVPVKDTIKFSAPDGTVESTPDRNRLWTVQTPQVFRLALYRQALRQAEAAGKDYTDDCQLVEALPHTVRLVQGHYSNIKVTTPEDVALAERWITP